MPFDNMLFWTILIFLILNLVIGIRAGKGVDTIKKYVLGNKNFSTKALVLTYVATYIGGGVMFGDWAGDVGLIAFLSITGSYLSDFFRASLLPSRMKKFRNCITMSDMMGMLYGKEARAFSGLMGIAMCLIVIILQITAIGTICEKFLSINSNIGIITGGTLLAVYSIHGGIRSVTATDILQSILLFATVIIISNSLIIKIGGIDIFINSVSKTSFPTIPTQTLYKHLSLFIMWFFFSSSIANPTMMQRVLMANSSNQIKNLFLSVGSIGMLFHILLLIISLGGVFLYANIPSNEVIYRLTTDLVPKELYGIVVIGLLSIVGSTADSYMHSAGISFGLDIVNIEEDKKVFYSKLGTFLVSGLAIFIAVMKISIFNYLGFRAYQVMAVTITCPLLLGILDVKPSKRAFWASCICSTSTFAVLFYLFPTTYEPIFTLVALTVNLIVFLLVHYIEYGKIVIINNDPIVIKNAPKDDTSFWTKLKYTYLGSPAHNTKNPYLLFGSFCIANILTPLFMYGTFSDSLLHTITHFKIVTIILCVLLMVHDLWYRSLRQYLPIFYNVTITYCLPFISASMFILTQGRVEWLTNFAVSAMFLMMLVSHRAFFVHLFLGTGLAWYLFRDYYDFAGTLSISNPNLYLISYQIVFVAIVGLLFSRDKQAYIEKINYAKNFHAILDKQKSTDLHKLESSKEKYYTLLGREEIDIVKRLDNAIQFSNLNQKENLTKCLKDARQYMASLVQRSTQYMRLAVDDIPMSEIIDSLENSFSTPDSAKEVFVVNTSTSDKIACDYIGLLRIMTYLFMKYQKDCVKSHQELLRNILIYISDTKLTYTVEKFTTYKKTIDAIKIVLSSSDHVSDQILNAPCQVELSRGENIYPINQEDFDLQAIQRVVSAHYGTLVDYSTEDDSIIGVCLPMDVYSIRPANLDIEGAEENLQISRSAIDLETKFLQKFHRLNPNISNEKLKSALKVIKKYHSHQIRKCGEPYYTHPINVANIIMNIIAIGNLPSNTLKQNAEDLIISALLHDVLEDTALHPIDMKIEFGEKITATVLDVTKIEHQIKERVLTNHEAFSKMKSQNIFAVCIKLADRIHNLMTLDGHKEVDKRKKIAQETLDFFIEPAESLGFVDLTKDLKEASLYVLKHGEIAGYTFGDYTKV